MKITFTLLLILVISQNTFATRYYVNSSAAGNGNGLSWTNAFPNLQEALSIVVFGDEIWTASGQYRPTTSTDRSVSFVLRDGVNIYGSFAGDETDPGQRNITDNPTTLNGDIGEIGEISDNSYNIIRANNLTSSIILDGFRIINGNSNNASTRGGGLAYTNSLTGNLLLKNCYFFSNRATNYGGAIYLRQAKLTIEDCDFRNNQTSGGDGGAIYTLNDGNYSTLIIRGSKFIGNTSRIGACLANTSPYQSLIIDRCIFTNNTSQLSIVEIDTFYSAKITNSYFIGNSVNDFASNLLYVLHYTNDDSEEFEMANCTIANNYNIYTSSPIQEELIKLSKSYYKVSNCIIYGNTQYQGREIGLGNTISHCLIENGYPGGTEVINANPLFVNPNPAGNVNFDATLNDYTLSVNSPCINVGDNSLLDPIYNSDLNNEQRIQGTIVDLGCYESNIDLSNISVIHSDQRSYYYDYVTGKIHFNLNKLLNRSFQIYDLNGRLLLNEKITDTIYKLNFKPQTYILKVDGNQPSKIVR